MNVRPLLALGVMVLGLTACGTPVVHTAAPIGTTARDDGLVGEWATSDPGEPLQVRAVVAGPTAPTSDRYAVSLTIHHEKNFVTALSLDVHITDIGEGRYIDVFLAESERNRLVGSYGFLVAPVHQIVKIHRRGDAIDLWMFDRSWLKDATGASAMQATTVPIGDRDVVLLTAPSSDVRAVIAQIAEGGHTHGDPIRLRRLR